jgi:hypothetical protein
MDHSFALSPDSMSVAATQPFEENTDSMSQWDPSQPRVVARLLSQLPTVCIVNVEYLACSSILLKNPQLELPVANLRHPQHPERSPRWPRVNKVSHSY